MAANWVDYLVFDWGILSVDSMVEMSAGWMVVSRAVMWDKQQDAYSVVLMVDLLGLTKVEMTVVPMVSLKVVNSVEVTGKQLAVP